MLWKVYLCQVSGYYHFRVHTHTGEEHLYLLRSGVLCFVEYYNRVVQGASAHECQRRYLNDVVVHVLLKLCHWYHILQRVIERLKVWVNLVAHVTGQESELFTGFYSGATEDNFPYFAVLECLDGKCYGGICLSCSGRSYCKQHVVLLELLDEAALVFGTWVNRTSVDVVYNDIAVIALIAFLSVYGIYDCLFVKTVVFVAVFHKQFHNLAETVQFLFVSHNLDDIVTCNNTQL